MTLIIVNLCDYSPPPPSFLPYLIFKNPNVGEGYLFSFLLFNFFKNI